MKSTRWFAILFAAFVIVSCFLPWVRIESKGIVISGFKSDINYFGKPGLMHSFFCGLCILFLLINRIWSVRIAFFASFINIAWGVRNFFLIPACTAGECPTKLAGIYFLLISCVLTTVFILFTRPRETQ